MKSSKRMFIFDHKQIARRVKDSDLTMFAFLEDAKVAESVWYRWVQGKTTPNLENIEKLADALARLEKRAERKAKRTKQ